MANFGELKTRFPYIAFMAQWGLSGLRHRGGEAPPELPPGDERGGQGAYRGGRRALSPLYWSHVNPYGTFRLDMERRLDLNRGPASGPDSHAPTS